MKQLIHSLRTNSLNSSIVSLRSKNQEINGLVINFSTYVSVQNSIMDVLREAVERFNTLYRDYLDGKVYLSFIEDLNIKEPALSRIFFILTKPNEPLSKLRINIHARKIQSELQAFSTSIQQFQTELFSSLNTLSQEVSDYDSTFADALTNDITPLITSLIEENGITASELSEIQQEAQEAADESTSEYEEEIAEAENSGGSGLGFDPFSTGLTGGTFPSDPYGLPSGLATKPAAKTETEREAQIQAIKDAIKAAQEREAEKSRAEKAAAAEEARARAESLRESAKAAEDNAKAANTALAIERNPGAWPTGYTVTYTDNNGHTHTVYVDTFTYGDATIATVTDREEWDDANGHHTSTITTGSGTVAGVISSTSVTYSDREETTTKDGVTTSTGTTTIGYDGAFTFFSTGEGISVTTTNPDGTKTTTDTKGAGSYATAQAETRQGRDEQQATSTEVRDSSAENATALNNQADAAESEAEQLEQEASKPTEPDSKDDSSIDYSALTDDQLDALTEAINGMDHSPTNEEINDLIESITNSESTSTESSSTTEASAEGGK